MPRLAAIVVALVLPGLALAQNLYPTPLDWRPWDMDFASPGGRTEVMRLPLTQSGAGFDCTGATSCLSWDGSALVETAGLTWTQNGTVPQVAANTLPTTASSGAAGPFSDANYYSNGSGSDALDSTGDRWGCASFVPTTAATQVLVSNGIANTAGNIVNLTAGGFLFHSYTGTTDEFAATTTTPTLSGYNVGCWWRTGTTVSAKLNLGATNTDAAAGTEVSGTAYALKVGRYEVAGSSFTGKILHVVQGLGSCPMPPAPFAATCEGWATYQMKRQFGLIGSRGEEITFTRATTATNEVNGVTWNVPSGVPRVTTQGLLVERLVTNYVLNSGTHPKAAEATGSITATQACVGWHEGTGTMTIANGTATTTGLSCTAVSPGTLCTFTVTATGTMAITTSAGTVTKAQIECPGSTKTSYQPTAGTAVARNADVATVPTPAGLSPSRWCVEVTGTPYGGRAWTSANAYLWSMGTLTAANTANAYAASTGAVEFTTYDSSAAFKVLTSVAHGWGPASTHRAATGNSNGTMSIRGDGAYLAGSLTGAGTGVQTSTSTPLYLGSRSTASAYWDGYLRDLRVYRSPLCR